MYVSGIDQLKQSSVITTLTAEVSGVGPLVPSSFDLHEQASRGPSPRFSALRHTPTAPGLTRSSRCGAAAQPTTTCRTRWGPSRESSTPTAAR